MASYLKSQNLTNGVEEVNKKIEVSNGGAWLNLERINVRRDGGSGVIRLGEIGSDHEKGELYIVNGESDSMLMSYSNNSTVDLPLSIKNTKATLEDGDLFIYNTANSTFKVDNISNYAGTGNYHVLKVEFEANADYETTTVLPVGSQVDKMIIKSSGLTTGTAPLQFFINGATQILLAEQGVEFDNTAGNFTITYFSDNIDIIVASGEQGTFKSEWSGAGPGTGAGFAYLFYWTPLP